MENLKKRRIIRKNDTIIFDRGYYSYKNYQIGISKYKIVPLIFPKENFKIQKLNDKLTYPLQVFNNKKTEKQAKKLYNTLKTELLKKIAKWKKYKPIRGKIEDFFKLCKSGLSLKKLHKIHTRISQKNHHTNCTFSRTHHNNRLQYQNSPTKAFRNMKNLRP
jgi:hypothetical protein